MDAHSPADHGLAKEPHAWALQLKLLEHLERAWPEPDEGIWEIRGDRRHFVHSKVMAWVAFDRGVRTVEEQGLDSSLHGETAYEIGTA
jgi:GH15 family glucan-1,4-alpha-glucosidase